MWRDRKRSRRVRAYETAGAGLGLRRQRCSTSTLGSASFRKRPPTTTTESPALPSQLPSFSTYHHDTPPIITTLHLSSRHSTYHHDTPPIITTLHLPSRSSTYGTRSETNLKVQPSANTFGPLVPMAISDQRSGERNSWLSISQTITCKVWDQLPGHSMLVNVYDPVPRLLSGS
jgi:hypothetical protein